jgi:nascent polypeptide-associated complex subunit beta
VINGNGVQKDMAQLLPNILTQLGPESLAELKKLAEQFQAAQLASKGGDAGDDDDVPDLVETDTFDQQE